MAEPKIKSEKVKITIPRAKNGEAKDLFVAVNGVNYLIPKGQTVEVPDFVAEEIKRGEAAANFMEDERDRMLSAGQQPMN
ncbi:MAG: hypothetical protein IJI06_08655 [Oscillospiraceae bacterium]|nr:hypothetical protein [Oscillospiraceae bacterium]